MEIKIYKNIYKKWQQLKTIKFIKQKFLRFLIKKSHSYFNMVNTIDMQDIRHLNLFGKITKVTTRFCFRYNRTIIFCVPRPLIPKAIGKGGKNVKQISEILRKKIKIIPIPQGIKDAKYFIEKIVSPVTFKNLEIRDDGIILTAGTQSKAALIGRNKRRLFEIQKISKNYFGKEIRIV